MKRECITLASLILVASLGIIAQAQAAFRVDRPSRSAEFSDRPTPAHHSHSVVGSFVVDDYGPGFPASPTRDEPQPEFDGQHGPDVFGAAPSISIPSLHDHLSLTVPGASAGASRR